jgi:NadR type nicotinamide-nucleotide adenylyltransferase
VVTGPESTGKSTLTQGLARHFSECWTPEYSRHYLERLGRPYRESDLRRIAEGQILWESYVAAFARRLWLCDTSLLVIKVWSDYRYGRCHPWIVEQLRRRPVDLYLLCDIDLPWEPDPLRENPHDRDVLLAMYQDNLWDLGVPYTLVSGLAPRRRLRQAIAASERLLFDFS